MDKEKLKEILTSKRFEVRGGENGSKRFIYIFDELKLCIESESKVLLHSTPYQITSEDNKLSLVLNEEPIKRKETKLIIEKISIDPYRFRLSYKDSKEQYALLYQEGIL
ncbi:MAG: hypothetical protein AB7P01_13735 [Bacteroidia bacterium]